MKVFVCLFALAILLAAPAVAQNYVYVTDNNPTTGGGNSWPFNFGSTTGRFMQILNASYLSTLAGPWKVTEVAFSKYGDPPSYPNSFVVSQFQMRMSHTTVATPPSGSFAGISGPCPTELIDTSSGFTYAVPSKDVWTDIGTVLDFGWDGKSNICLEIRYRGQVTSLGFPCHSGTIPRIWANSTAADNYVATSGSVGTGSGLKVRLTVDPNNVLLAPDTASIGTTVGVVLVNAPAGSLYQVAASLGQTPLPLGKCTIGLTFDTVFLTSVLVGPPVFNGYGGQVSASGTATAKLSLPAIPALVGICAYHAAVLFDKSGILGCTNTAGTLISK
jgi:hypothetical protein